MDLVKQLLYYAEAKIIYFFSVKTIEKKFKNIQQKR